MVEVALVTGGTGALGRSVVTTLVGAGYDVTVPYVVPEEWQRLESDLGQKRDKVLGIEGNALDPDFLEQAIGQAVEKFGGLSALVHLLGGYAHGSLEDTGLDLWQRMMRLNLESAYLAAQASLPHLSKGSSMLFVGAEAGIEAPGGQPAYNASKAGLMTLGRSLAHELGDRGIRVNVIAPDIMDTEANRRAMPKGNFDRWLKPEQVAQVVRYLLSDDASAVTGAIVPLTNTPRELAAIY
ncbi:MAG: SDR family NAD(P)-dependent oxidoreductase [Chloroflexota bacterium]